MKVTFRIKVRVHVARLRYLIMKVACTGTYNPENFPKQAEPGFQERLESMTWALWE